MGEVVVQGQAKAFWRSKTLIFNAIAAAAVVFWPEVQRYLTPEQAGAIVVAANVLLRFVTDSPVKVA